MDPREQARRAYELGRMKVALVRAAPALAFGAAAVGFASAEATPTFVMATLLGLASAGLVFIGGAAGRAVPAGLLAGWIPFVLPLLVRGQVCPMGGACEAWCVTACVIGGTAAGTWLGWRSAREENGWPWLVSGLGLAGVAGALGCSCVGIPGLVGMALGSILASSVARRLALASTTRPRRITRTSERSRRRRTMGAGPSTQ